ncbi:MAG TPA: ANTAR domain-containing protein [Nakamurella sp.]|nr:ANTAR domain-containing protein [Nakamurella sp.]
MELRAGARHHADMTESTERLGAEPLIAEQILRTGAGPASVRESGETAHAGRQSIRDQRDQADADQQTIRNLQNQAEADQQTIRNLQDEADANRAAIRELEEQASVDRAVIAVLQAEGEIDRGQIANLEAALVTARRIGAAMGVLMARHRMTDSQAFDVLRKGSQHTNRKLRDVADEVVLTGLLPGK